MGARLLEGGPLAEQLRAEIAADVAKLKKQGRQVCLAAIQVGGPAASLVYVRNQERACKKVGIAFRLCHLPEKTTQHGLLQQINRLNRAPDVHGIILQLPLPAHLDSIGAIEALDPAKDAEGVHPENLGELIYGDAQCAPCTAMAAYRLIKSTGEQLAGMEAVVVGHSQIVGKPVGLLLLQDLCTVSTCHIATRDLAAHTRKADLLVVAVGKAGLIRPEMVKPGALVVDIGVNRIEETNPDGSYQLDETGKVKTRLVGDVVYETVREIAGWITPVPGGVGPMTVTMLLRNVTEAAKRIEGHSRNRWIDTVTPLLPFES